jgi:hypothetical protein
MLTTFVVASFGLLKFTRWIGLSDDALIFATMLFLTIAGICFSAWQAASVIKP